MMDKINAMLIMIQIKAMCALEDFKNEERGDTNFISMMIIIGIVVVLAGLFLTLGRSVMSTITEKVTSFINGL